MKFILPLFTFFLCLALPGLLSAQKANDQYFTFAEYRLAADPLPGEFESYSVALERGSLDAGSLGITPTSISQAMGFQRWTRKTSGGDLEILVTLNGPDRPTKEMKSKMVEVGTKEKPRKEKRFYYTVSGYGVSASYSLLDGERNIIRDGNASSGGGEYNTSDNKSSSALVKLWNDKYYGEWKSKRNSAAQAAVAEVASKLRTEIDEGYYNTNIPLYTIRKAEKYDVVYMDTAVDDLKAATETYNKDKNFDALQAAFLPYMELWAENVERFDPEDKKEDDLYFAHAFNVGTANFILGDMEEAAAWATTAEAAGKRKATVAGLRSLIEKRQAALDVNANLEITAVGDFNPAFSREAMAEAAAAEAAAEARQRRLDRVAAMPQGTIHMKDGAEITGGINVRYDKNDILQTIYASTISETGSVIRTPAAASQVLYLDMEGRRFPVMKAGNTIGIGQGPNLQLMEILQEDEGTGSFIARLYYVGDGLKFRNYFFKDGRKDEIYNFNSTRFLVGFSKTAGKVFGEDCATVAQKGDNKEYEHNEAGFLQLFADYTGCFK